MATYYVWHGSAQDDSDATWNSSTLAKVTLGAAVTAAATIGDLILVHKAHTETLAAHTTYTANSVHTETQPLRIIVVDKDASDAPVDGHADMGANGISGVSNSVYINIAGFVYIWGLRIINGFHSVASFGVKVTKLENCEYGINNASNRYFAVSQAGTVFFINCLMSFAGGGTHHIFLTYLASRIHIYGGSITHTATPSYLVNIQQDGAAIDLFGVDLTGVDPSTTWIRVDSINRDNTRGTFVNCAFPAAPSTFFSGSGSNSDFSAVNCGGVDGRYYSNRWDNANSLIHDTGIYRTSGAKYDGTNGYSFNVLTSIVNDHINPFRQLLAVIDGGSLDGKDLEIHLTHDNADNSGAIQDDEIWAEFHALDDTAGVHWETTRSKPTATPADLAADSGEAWTGAKTYKQKISHTWAAGATSGLVYVYLCVAKAFAGGSGADVFICPKVDIV